MSTWKGYEGDELPHEGEERLKVEYFPANIAL